MKKLTVCTVILQIALCVSFSYNVPNVRGHRHLSKRRIKSLLQSAYNNEQSASTAVNAAATGGGSGSALGPPEPIRSLKIGESLQAFRRSYK
eukprot:3364961-Ditylum_brightwellii.AAC.1